MYLYVFFEIKVQLKDKGGIIVVFLCLFLYAKDTQLMWYSCVLASIWAQTLMDSIRLERLLFFFMSINVGYIFILPPNSTHSGRRLFGYLHPSFIPPTYAHSGSLKNCVTQNSRTVFPGIVSAETILFWKCKMGKISYM